MLFIGSKWCLQNDGNKKILWTTSGRWTSLPEIQSNWKGWYYYHEGLYTGKEFICRCSKTHQKKPFLTLFFKKNHVLYFLWSNVHNMKLTCWPLWSVQFGDLGHSHSAVQSSVPSASRIFSLSQKETSQPVINHPPHPVLPSLQPVNYPSKPIMNILSPTEL